MASNFDGDENRRLAEIEASAIFESYRLDDRAAKDWPQDKPHFFEHRHRESEVFLADVEADAQAFSGQLRAAAGFGPEPMPCISFGNSGPVPLDYADFFKFVIATDGPREFYDFPFGPMQWRHAFREMRGELKEWLGGPEINMTFVHPMEALGFFKTKVVDFLTDRFAGRSQAGVSPSPGVRFKVMTQNQGDRVHYSPAYFVKLSTVFGAPSSPVISWIQPGRYVFAVVGPNGRMRFDPGQFAVPPAVYTLLRAQLPARLVDELYAVMRKVKHSDPAVLRGYMACLREISHGFGPAERFIQQRIEGLERLLR